MTLEVTLAARDGDPARAVLVHRFKDFTAKLFLSSLLSFCVSSVLGPSML